MRYLEDEAVENIAGSENGCYVDGHWGIYAPCRMVEAFSGVVYELSTEEHLLIVACSSPVDDDADLDALISLADEAEQLVNRALPDNRVAHWHDGEFFISPYCGGEEECEDETCACHC